MDKIYFKIDIEALKQKVMMAMLRIKIIIISDLETAYKN
jgi:hypothetical protein